jgi:GDSL-like Lipase/Acylhydrolase family
MNPGLRKAAFAAVPAVAVVLLLLVGAAMAYTVLLLGARRMVLRHREVATMGGLLDEQKRRSLALAYEDPEQAEREIGGYAWETPKLPTPFVGAAAEPGIHGNATINSLQFRAREEVLVPKPESRFRIFVTGGSTAFGVGAPSQDRTISGYLETQLARELTPLTGLRYEVWNTASTAWTSTHERILIENRISELEPDLVVSLSGNNDVHWGYRGHDVLWMRTYGDTLFFRVLQVAWRDMGLGQLKNVARHGPRVPPDVVGARLAKNVRLALAALEPTGVPYAFALQPTLAATHKQLSAREAAKVHSRDARDPERGPYFQNCYAAMERELPRLDASGLHYVDLTGVFDADGPEQEIFLDSYHFGDRGNRRIAEALFAAIRPVILERARARAAAPH